MSKLFLLRHAKAGWALPGVRDYDRSLDASGHVDAEALGTAMRARGYVPDITLCSNARRALETLEGIAGNADTGRVLFFERLYSDDSAAYLSLIHEHSNVGSVLVIGHNPMMEDLAITLAGDGEHSARATLNSGFPTSGLAVIRFPGGLADAIPGAGFLEAFLTPADL